MVWNSSQTTDRTVGQGRLLPSVSALRSPACTALVARLGYGTGTVAHQRGGQTAAHREPFLPWRRSVTPISRTAIGQTGVRDHVDYGGRRVVRVCKCLHRGSLA